LEDWTRRKFVKADHPLPESRFKGNARACETKRAGSAAQEAAPRVEVRRIGGGKKKKGRQSERRIQRKIRPARRQLSSGLNNDNRFKERKDGSLSFAKRRKGLNLGKRKTEETSSDPTLFITEGLRLRN